MILRPDLLVCWIRHVDYPIFRLFLKKHHRFFNKIIIYWSEHHRESYYDKFIEEAFKSDGIKADFIQPIEYKYGVEDWRDIATKQMMKYSSSEWVCSIEQDWFSRDWQRLLDITELTMKDNDMFGWWNPTNFPYIHPAFWFIKRELLERTGKDFAPHPDINGCDHFAMITKRALELGAKVTTLQKIAIDCSVESKSDCFHLGGVNQNYLEGLKDGYVFHRPNIFNVYNYWCRKADVLQAPPFLELSNKMEKKMISLGFGNGFEDSEWSVFFK